MTRAAEGRILTPTVLITLGTDVRPLVPALTLAIARRSPSACRLQASVDLSNRPHEVERLFRAAMERVTALPGRNAAVRAGYAIRDEVFVPLVFALGGGTPDAEEIQAAVETLGVLASDFFRGSNLDFQLVGLLPDLGARNAERYRQAYEQLAIMDRAGGDDAPRVNGRPLLRRRWVADCRTQAGAHAGDVPAVVHPLAEFLSTIVVGDELRALDADVDGILHGAVRDRLTGYSAPGYAEIVFEPRVLIRHLACRAAVDIFGAMLDRGLEEADTIALEEAADRCFAEMDFPNIANGLLDPPGPGMIGESRAVAVHALGRARKRAREAALQQVLVRTRTIADAAGAAAATLFPEVLQRPIEEHPVGQIRSSISLESLRKETEDQIRETLGVPEMLTRADALEADAEEILRSEMEPAPSSQGGGAESEDHIATPPEGSSGARATALRKEALALRAEAAYLDAQLGPGGDLDVLEEKVLASLSDASTSSEEPQVPRGEMPSGVRTWIGHWFSRPAKSSAAPPAVLEPAQAVVAFTPVRTRLLVEWLRWIREFERDLARFATEVRVWAADMEQSRQYYAREADTLGRDLWTHRVFSHRLLSKRQCDDLYGARCVELIHAVERRGVLPLTKYLDLLHTPLELLQQPVNERFSGLDPAIDEAALDVMADWVAWDVEDILFNDPQVVARAATEDRLRAMGDSAQPLLRPEDPELTPAIVTVGLLAQPDESHVPSIWRGQPPVEWISSGDRRRVAIRTALHGFAVHALPQLRPLRESAVATKLPDGDEPLPRASLVEEPLDEFIVLGLALGYIAREERSLKLQGLPVLADEAALAQALRTTFEGRREFFRIRRLIGQEVREPETLERLKGLAQDPEQLSSSERSLLGRVAEDLESGRWPSALPWEEESYS
jgi:hypothetical protein